MAKKVGILGAGESGTGAALLAKAKGMQVFVSDMAALDNEQRALFRQHNIQFEEGNHDMSKLQKCDLIVKSPGIPKTSKVVQGLSEKGIKIIGELEFAYRYIKATCIGITGTNGKTTTTLLTYHLLKSSGLNVAMAGNVGQSLAQLAIDDVYDYYVIEMSSFQLEDCYDFVVDTALLLNITPDHLDRYDYKMSNYTAAKFRITRHHTSGQQFIYNQDDPVIMAYMEKHLPPSSLYPVSFKNSLKKGAYLDDKDLIFHVTAGDDLVFNLTLDDIPIKGPHNLMNAMSAILAASIYVPQVQLIKKGLKTFKNIEHRLEYVDSIRGIDFINDSKATNVDAVKQALLSFDKPIVWIAGGVDKGNDYSELRDVIKRVKGLVCLGIDNTKLTGAFRGLISDIETTDSMSVAISKAADMADEGDVILLSPACASFDLFKNYEDRGNQFKQAVMRYASRFKRKKLMMLW